MKINIYNITFIENCCLKKDLFPSPIQSLFRRWRRCTRKWREILDFSCKMLTEKTRLPLTFLRLKRNHFASKVFSFYCQSHCFHKSDVSFAKFKYPHNIKLKTAHLFKKDYGPVTKWTYFHWNRSIWIEVVGEPTRTDLSWRATLNDERIWTSSSTRTSQESSLKMTTRKRQQVQIFSFWTNTNYLSNPSKRTKQNISELYSSHCGQMANLFKLFNNHLFCIFRTVSYGPKFCCSFVRSRNIKKNLFFLNIIEISSIGLTAQSFQNFSPGKTITSELSPHIAYNLNCELMSSLESKKTP